LPCRTYDIVPVVAALHPADIYSVTAPTNFRWFITGGADGIIRKWDTFASLNGKTPLTQAQRQGQVDSVTKAGVLLTSWPLHSPSPSPSSSSGSSGKRSPLSPVYSLACHPEAVWALAGAGSGDICLYTLRSDEGLLHATLPAGTPSSAMGEEVREGHTAPVSVLTLGSDATQCFSGSWDKRILQWDLSTGKVAQTYVGATSQVAVIQKQPTSTDDLMGSPEPAGRGGGSSPLLMNATVDGQVMLWDQRMAHFAGKFTPPDRVPPWLLSATWGADGQYIYVGRRNGTVEEWDVRGDRLARTLRLPSQSGPVHHVHAMPSGRHLLCGSMDNLRLWDLQADHEDGEGGGFMGVGSIGGGRLPPFRVLPGHHGGVIAGIIRDEKAKYVVSISGTRGWEGQGNRGCLLYDVRTVL
ncbi:MAG: WD40-repeat-containing domain protein, partial [Piptocephalis tieghemiana]